MFDVAQPDAAEIVEAQEAENVENLTTEAQTPEDAETAPESLSEPSTAIPDEDAETFPRDYVEKLRKENGNYRQKAKDAEQTARDADAFAQGFARRLHTALVAANGTLADPTDLEFQIEHLMDEDALTGAIESLLAEKPHLRARKPVGDVGQGNRGDAAAGFSLIDALRSRA